MHNMQDLRLCVVVVTEARVPTAALPPCPVALASVPKANPTRNLLVFTFRPDGMKGKELFAHMCKLRNRAAPSTGVDVSPRAGDIEITDTQRSIIQPTDTDLLLGSIVRESALTGANRKLPQRRLNAVGEINNRCVVGNSEDRSRKLEEAMMLGKSLEMVSRCQQASKSNKEGDEMKEMHAKAPAAIAKYIAKGCDAAKLTIPELEALARVELATPLKGKDKAEKVAMFVAKVKELSWAPARSEWQQWNGRAVKRAGKAGTVTGRGKDPQSVVIRYDDGGEEDVTFEALAELMAAADAIPRGSLRQRSN
jgi:hypothetical protein